MKFRYFFLAFLLLTALSVSTDTSAEAKKYPVTDFYRPDKFESIKISPTGEYLAVTAAVEGSAQLLVIQLSDMSVTAKVIPELLGGIKDFYWANDRRILFSVHPKLGSFKENYKKIYSIDIDGSPHTEVASGEIIDTLVHDDDHVLIAPYKFYEMSGAYRDYEAPAKLVNINSGQYKATKAIAPLPNCDLFYDNLGEPRFASCIKKNEITQSFYFKTNEKTNWKIISSQKETGQQIVVIGFSGDNKKVYLQLDQESGPDSIYVFDADKNEKTFLMRDKTVDPEGVLKSPIDNGIYAIRFNDGLPRTAFINKNDSFALDLQKLLNTFPNDDVYPTSFSKDGRLGLYVVTSDIRPAEFYLYDRTTGKASLILSSADWFRSEDLSIMMPVKFTARDGQAISAFVTVPNGSTGKNLPVIINPHGGPIGLYDTWGFNRETQLLANRGYAVMQVNFRGSGNYGKAFTMLGYGQWGRTMQDDLTDATRWLITQGIADPKRICIYGASYGGYAALMGAAKEPDLYQCAVGNVGVYDLSKVYYDDSDARTRSRMRLNILLGKVGHSENSPNLLADKVKIPVLLAAGEYDDIAPSDHTKMMHDALTRYGVPVEMVIYPKEGHGNHIMANKLDFAERLLAFLDKHIGSKKAADN